MVEISVCTPHAATAPATLFNSFVVGAAITDSGCSYTNVPTVMISGGGGSGATAHDHYFNSNRDLCKKGVFKI